MDIKKIYHIEINKRDWEYLKNSGTLHFKINGEECLITKGL